MQQIYLGACRSVLHIKVGLNPRGGPIWIGTGESIFGNKDDLSGDPSQLNPTGPEQLVVQPGNILGNYSTCEYTCILRERREILPVRPGRLESTRLPYLCEGWC